MTDLDKIITGQPPCNYLSHIHVEQLFHLNGLHIDLGDAAKPHLILTGRNGSGKTVLLNAIADILDKEVSQRLTQKTQMILDNLPYEIQADRLSIKFSSFKSKQFLIAFYQANRSTSIEEPQFPQKPKIYSNYLSRDYCTDQFLNFLSDLKIQEAIAKMEGNTQVYDELHNWFGDFEKLMQSIYEDDELKLKYEYQSYGFLISTQGKEFKFTQLSDGYMAILEIVADLIMKMREPTGLVNSYQKPGIVLIDEVETHLHLSLQKNILPLLTRLFPRIQFIVTTHSPLVLNSIPNAVAYDLEHQELISDLTDYSYATLAEGYFEVDTESSFARERIEKLTAFLQQETLSEADRAKASLIVKHFEALPETAMPGLVGGYKQLKLKYFNKIQSLKQ